MQGKGKNAWLPDEKMGLECRREGREQSLATVCARLGKREEGVCAEARGKQGGKSINRTSQAPADWAHGLKQTVSHSLHRTESVCEAKDPKDSQRPHDAQLGEADVIDQANH